MNIRSTFSKHKSVITAFFAGSILTAIPFCGYSRYQSGQYVLKTVSPLNTEARVALVNKLNKIFITKDYRTNAGIRGENGNITVIFSSYRKDGGQFQTLLTNSPENPGEKRSLTDNFQLDPVSTNTNEIRQVFSELNLSAQQLLQPYLTKVKSETTITP